jgi:hypothetical protein
MLAHGWVDEAIPAAAAAAPTATPNGLVGWWDSDTLCLELFANGDFELSRIEPGQAKEQAIGTAGIASDGAAVKLQVQRIWIGRFVTACRKHSHDGHWGDSWSALGVALKPRTTVQLT